MKIHSLCKSGFMRCTNGWYDISLPVCLELVTIAYWDCSNILHCNMQFPSPASSANALLIELCVVHDCTLQLWICLLNQWSFSVSSFMFPGTKTLRCYITGGLSSFGWWGTRVALLVFGFLNFQWGPFSSLGAVLRTAFLLFATE